MRNKAEDAPHNSSTFLLLSDCKTLQIQNKKHPSKGLFIQKNEFLNEFSGG